MSEHPRWNDWTRVQPVQFDYESKATARAVRLSSPAARVGDPVRIVMAGVEVDAVILEVDGPVLRVKAGKR